MTKPYRIFVVVAVIALSLACWSRVDSAVQEKKGMGEAVAAPAQKWEYKVAPLGRDDPAVEKELNKLGVEGWELVGTPGVNSGAYGNTPISTTVRLIFKRPKQ